MRVNSGESWAYRSGGNHSSDWLGGWRGNSPKFPASWENTGNFVDLGPRRANQPGKTMVNQAVTGQFPTHPNRDFLGPYRELNGAIRELSALIREPLWPAIRGDIFLVRRQFPRPFPDRPDESIESSQGTFTSMPSILFGL
jgi:hypothetical protein